MKGFLRDMGFGRAPHNPTDDVFQLNVMDRAGAISNMMGWTMLRFDQVLDPVMLRETLVSVIKTGDWRKLGGRFRRNVSGSVVRILRLLLHSLWCEAKSSLQVFRDRC